MKNKHLFSMAMLAVVFFGTNKANAQGLSVNTTGSPAAASAILDASSSTQGMLVPRMDSTHRSLIGTPANGLLVYQTDGVISGFYFYDGTIWKPLGGGAPSGTAGGDLTGTYPNPTLATTGVAASTYGGATTSPTIAVDAKGRITSATNTTITGVTPGGSATGDLTGSYPGPTLTTTGVAASTYGGATTSPTIAVDAKGRITSATNTTITGVTPGGAATGDLTGTYPGPTLTTTGVAASTYGGATTSPTIAVDAKGRITSATNTTITGVTPGGAATGDLTGTYPGPTLTTTGVAAATYGGATTSPTIAVDAKGRITSATNTAIGGLNASVLTAGTVATARLGSGTANSTTFLRGDQTWQTVAASGFSWANFYFTNGAASFFMGPNMTSATTAFSANEAEQPVPVACTLDAIYMSGYVTDAFISGATNAVTATIYVNGSATPMTLSLNFPDAAVAGSSIAAVGTVANPQVLAAGDRVAIFFSQNNFANGTVGMTKCSLHFH